MIVYYTVTDEYEDERIDKYISELQPELSRSYIQKLIKDGSLFVNNNPVKSNYRIKCDDSICFEIPENKELEIPAQNIPLEILYEDSELIVINKPKGMVVHPGAGHFTDTIVNALLYHCDDLSGINGILRPGIVHRIDKDTSGIIVCAKNDNSHKSLANQLKDHSMTRKYEAITVGCLKNESGTIIGNIGRKANNRKLMGITPNGKPAVTHYNLIKNYKNNSYIECVLETGRTHQIRVHMASINHPLVGDLVYGGKQSEFKLEGEQINGQALHAKTLGFIHPVTNKYMEFNSDHPDYFEKILNKMESQK